MAKKPKRMSLEVAAPSLDSTSKEAKEREERYRMEDDARSIKSYLDLRKSPERHQKAVNYIRSQAEELDGLEGPRTKAPRGKARQGRRRLPRNIGRA